MLHGMRITNSDRDELTTKSKNTGGGIECLTSFSCTIISFSLLCTTSGPYSLVYWAVGFAILGIVFGFYSVYIGGRLVRIFALMAISSAVVLLGSIVWLAMTD